MIFIIGQVSKKHVRAFIYLMLAISLYACGFQLRGSINLSEDMSPIYIEQNSVFGLAREIKSLLASNGIKVVENAKQSKAQLTLLNEEKTRRVLSVDGSGQAREYLIMYKVNFAINTKHTEISGTEKTATKNSEGVISQSSISLDSISQDSISLSRTWLFDVDAVLAVTNEAELLYNDMQREAARLILLKLNAASKKSVNNNKQ
jgi:outer membrane lipopolysaccharide assembly protein LptE/RlpB